MHGQDGAVAPTPRFDEGVRQHRQRPRLAVDLRGQQLRQPRFNAISDVGRRSFDRLAQRVLVERAEQVHAALGQPSQRRIYREVADVVRTNTHDHLGRLGQGDEITTERGGRGGCDDGGEQLLELIDHKRSGGVCVDAKAIDSLTERGAGIGTRGEHDHAPPAPGEPRRQSRTHERRLAATRRSGDHQQRRFSQARDAGRHLGVPPEKHGGVIDFVRRQALVRAGVVDDRHSHRRWNEGGIMSKDRRLQVHEVGSGIDPQLLDKKAANTRQRAERIGLTSTPVLRRRQRDPSPLTPGFLGHGHLGRHCDTGMVARRESRVEQPVLDTPTLLIEPTRLDHRRVPRLQVLERLPAPQHQG